MGSSASAALAALIALSVAGCAVDRTGLLVGDSGTPPVDLGEVDAFVENDANELDLGSEDLGADLGRDLGLEDLGPPGPIVALATGIFTRNLEAYQRDSDPIAGPFYSLVPADTLRYETLASGGRLALIEGARTNAVLRSRIRSGTGWGAGSGVVSTDSQPGPDGTNNASRENVTVGGFSRYAAGTPTPAPVTASLWQMMPAANASYHVTSWIDLVAPVHWEAASGLTSTWQRAIMRHTTGTARYLVPSDARAGALAAAPHDTISDFVQIEAGRFPSSPIVNAGTVGQTRPADALTWAAAPASLLSQRHGFRHVRPIFPSSSSVVDGDVFWLMSIADGSNGVRISQTGGIITIEAVEGGVVKASSPPFTTLADTDLGSVEWDPAAGLVYVNGTPGPAGTPWTWAPGALRVGGIYGGTSEAFCGLSDIW